MSRERVIGSINRQEAQRNASNETVLYRMLQCIPGVSSTKANNVVSHFHSVRELRDACEQEGEDLLSVRFRRCSEERIS